MLAGQLQDARERLLASFDGLTDEEMAQPGVVGGWSVRDVLAHLAGWDRGYIEMFRAMLAGERHAILDMDEGGNEAFNRENLTARSSAALDDVMKELTASRDELIELLRTIDNEQLFAPAPGDEHADMSIAACVQVAAAHDEEHAEMIEEWRNQLED
jgi:uncharacterized damage-inducible protein DinB